MREHRGTRIAVFLLAWLFSACNCSSTPPRKSDGGNGAPNPDSGMNLDGGPRDAGGLYPDGGFHRFDAGDGGGCGLRTCASAGATCGPIGDGCGELLQCGTCTLPQTCGGGGMPSVCGGTDGCFPRTCQSLDAGCGPVADGCGALLQCGSCPSTQSCGGGGFPNQCGGTAAGDGGLRLEPDGGCLPLTCATAGADCGPLGDGCGDLLQCGTCTGNKTCGGGGKPNVCAIPRSTCVPTSCADAGASCGQIGDGCGGSLTCGTCTAPQICGGGGVPNTCGGGSTDGGAVCTNLCLKQTPCSDGGTTTLSGVVYAPTNPDAGFGLPDPLPNALIYVPNGSVDAFPPGVSCDVCGAAASGSPLVSTTSLYDGSFHLKNVPVGKDIPVVFQLGRWRRQITVSTVAACTDNTLTREQTRMPRNQGEGDIPLIAMVTGAVDSVECVLWKMGIDTAEFTAPGAGGRVQFYIDNGENDPSGGSPDEEALVGSLSTLEQYDLTIFACDGNVPDAGQWNAEQPNVIAYTNEGGRVYATHYSYGWLYDDAPFSGTADWNVPPADPDDYTQDPNVEVDVQDPQFSNWLTAVGATNIPGQMSLGVLRNDFTGTVPPSETWLTWNGASPGWPIHYTFNTPVGADAGDQCGRVVFSDFHVENQGDTQFQIFPSQCEVAPMTPQEKVLEYMLFDLSSCITQSTPGPACTKLTCLGQGWTCGPQSDGCGGLLQCGTCQAPELCGGGGTPNVCGTPGCKGLSCAQQGFNCGPAGDGCGNTLQCGDCNLPETCGGGGISGVCGSGAGCTPLSCADQGLSCGPAGDGCGGTIASCGTCNPPQTCGGAGIDGRCGTPSCAPATCAGLGFNCGPAADGCGGTLECGTCDGGSCGGIGKPNVCGSLNFE